MDPSAGVAQCLVRQGLPAVIARHFAVSGEATAMLTWAFFAAVADGFSIDAALAEARKTLFIQGTAMSRPCACAAYARLDGKLFDLELVIPMAGGTELQYGLTDV